ncbi:MAG TPA: hypothetical protein VFV83_06845 [Chthoniobacteraceae bacterium]|nr:hypothetical protein [Chthoniobacteraceae bacterium]
MNATSREVRDGRAFCAKRRRRFAPPILATANIFFRLVRAPVRAIENNAEWQAWETESFRLLHGETSRCFPSGTRAVAVEEFDGINLTGTLDDGTLSIAMVRAVGAELRRAHEIRCEFFASGWSHGDPHLGNFIFDGATGRARIIDFELRHLRSLGERARRLDDLLGVLHDLLGRSPPARWVPSARGFVEGYGCRELTEAAIDQLAPPSGLAAIWWSIRTSWLRRDEAKRRIEELRQAAVS